MGLISQTVFNGGCHVLGYSIYHYLLISLLLIFALLLAVARKLTCLFMFCLYRVIPKALMSHEVCYSIPIISCFCTV